MKNCYSFVASTPATNRDINNCFCKAMVKTRVKKVMRNLATGAEGYNNTAWLANQVDLSKLPRMYKRLNETEREAVDIAVKLSVFSECVPQTLTTACTSKPTNVIFVHFHKFSVTHTSSACLWPLIILCHHW